MNNIVEIQLKCFVKTGSDVLPMIHRAAQKIRADLKATPAYRSDVLPMIHRAAQKIKADSKAAPAYNNRANIAVDHVADIIPSSLYLFVETLRSQDLRDNDDHYAMQRKRVLNTCQDILYAAPTGRQLTPKHIGIAATTHHATR